MGPRTALEAMMVTVRTDQAKLDEVNTAAASVLLLLESKLKKLDTAVQAAVINETKAQAVNAAQQLAAQLLPVITAAREARESFDRNASALTRRLKRSAAFAMTGVVIAGILAVIITGLAIGHWMPWQSSPAEQAQALQDLAEEVRANGFYRSHADIERCRTQDRRVLPCVRVLANEGVFRDAQGRVLYAIDPNP